MKLIDRNLLLAAVLAIATLPAQGANAQTNRMKECNADPQAKALKGDERKAFMKTCLSGGAQAAAAAAPSTPQERMKSCNADPKAKALKGDERKAFMKACLSGG